MPLNAPARSPRTVSVGSLSGSAAVVTIKAAPDIPARLWGGNAQEVEVNGFDYTLHLDISKLPTALPSLAVDQWTVVWNATSLTYERVAFTNLPVPGHTHPIQAITGVTISSAAPSGGADGDLWFQYTP